MRATVLTLVVLMASSLAGAQPGQIPFKSRELLPGKNLTQPMLAAPQVSESSGQFSQSYPISIPAGRGITPTLELQYSSSAGLSEFGLGWDLTVPTIERSIRFGVADYTKDLYRYKNGHTVAELLATGVVTTGGGVEYRERFEKSFNRYLRYGNRWTIQTPNGVRYELGSSVATRRGKGTVVGLAETAAWLVDRIIDTNNNYATYEYAPDSARNPQIRMIRYNGNAGTNLLPSMSVEFIWTSHWGLNAIESFRSGYLRFFGDRRLSSIILRVPKHTGNTSPTTPEMRTTTLTYSDPNATLDRYFYLQSARVESFPPTLFEYAQAPTTGVGFDLPVVGSNLFENLLGKQVPDVPGGAVNTTVAIAEVTGDAIPDIVQTCGAGLTTWQIYKNDGAQLTGASVQRPFDGQTPGHLPDACALRRSVGNLTVQDLVDLDGDGFSDVVYVDGTTMYYCKGTGNGFAPCAAYSSGVPATLRETDTSFQPDTLTVQDLVDFNGDGRVDILRTTAGVLSVYFNKGVSPAGNLGFAPPVTFAMPACPSASGLRCLRATQMSLVPGAQRVMLADLRDINGDGLPDFITSNPLTLSLSVAYGTGGEFEAPVSLNIASPVGAGVQSGSDYRALTDLVDVNGDGLADLVNAVGTNIQVALNNGRTWGTQKFPLPMPPQGLFSPGVLTQQTANGDDVLTNSMFTDFTGDGVPDFVSTALVSMPVTAVRVQPTSYSPPRRLVAIRSLSGNNVTEIAYQAEPDSKHVPAHVVEALKRRRTPLYTGEPTRVTSFESHYQYSNGYFDSAERAFMGFGNVAVSGPAWETNASTTYLTDPPRQGLTLLRLTSNNQASGTGDLTSSTYTVTPLSGTGDRTFARLDRVDSTPNFTQFTYTTFSNYDSFGHAQQTVSGGQANDITTTHSHSLIRQDDSFTLDALNDEYSSEAGVTGSRTLYTRDFKGNVTTVQRERDAGVFTTHRYTYDSNGNITSEIDEQFAPTYYEYDTTHKRYRVSTTTSVGVTSATYHALNDVPAKECDVQTAGTTKRCTRTEIDVAGRPTQIWLPTFSAGLFGEALLTTISYDDTSYPLQATAIKRGTSRSVQYIDGFGNVVEVKVEETIGLFRTWETSFDALAKPIRQELARREPTIAYTHASGGEAWLYDHDYVNGSIERVTFPRDSLTAPYESASRIDKRFYVLATDAGQLTARYDLDGHGRLTAIRRSKNGTTAVTKYGLDAQGYLSDVTDPAGLKTHYTRNKLGWIYGVTRPDGGEDYRTYNNRGQLTSVKDPRSVVVDYTYDTPGRLSRVVSSNEQLGVRHVDASVTYYGATVPSQRGWKSAETSDEITQTFTYNAEGLPASWGSQRGPYGGTVKFEYLLGGPLYGAYFPDGEKFGTSFNLDDSVREIWEDGDSYGTYLYDDDGQVSVVNNAFGLDEAYTYDARGRLVHIASTNTGIVAGPLVDDSITFSPGSLVTRIERRGLKPGLLVRTTPDVERITYDNLTRMSGVERNGVNIASYLYDLGGKITDYRDTPGITASTSVYQFDRLTQRTYTDNNYGTFTDVFSYDAAGAVVADNRKSSAGIVRMRVHQWDALGRYSRSGVDSADNLRDGTTEYFYSLSQTPTRVISPGDGLLPDDNLYIGKWARLNTTTGEWTNSVYANGSLVFSSIGPRAEFPHRTIQQSIAAISNDFGKVVRQEEFTPYGATSAGGGMGMIEDHYHGIRADELTIAGARAYDSSSGIWLRRDSAPLSNPEPSVAEPRLTAMYSFDFGSPLSYRDPDGRWPGQSANGVRTAAALSRLGATTNLALALGGIAAGVFLADCGRQQMQAAQRDREMYARWQQQEDDANNLFWTMHYLGVGAPLLLEASLYESSAATVVEHEATVVTSSEAAAPAAVEAAAVDGVITIKSSAYPESATHILEAQSAGQPSVLTIDRAGAQTRRAQSLRGIPTRPGLDRDEYPPAMFLEGGTGSSVKHIDRSDNRGAGACIGNSCRSFPDGSTIRIDVE